MLMPGVFFLSVIENLIYQQQKCFVSLKYTSILLRLLS